MRKKAYEAAVEAAVEAVFAAHSFANDNPLEIWNEIMQRFG